MSISERDVAVAAGRIAHVFDTGELASDGVTLVWHHGSPQTGALLDPLVAASRKRGIRLISYGRPSYGGSTANPGRSVASAAADVAAITDALGVGRFVVMGASGGAPHAFACAAELAGRVTASACIAGIAPYRGDDHWFDGMSDAGGLRAALGGRAARASYAESDEFDETSFIAADWAALEGEWSSLGHDAGKAEREGPDGLIDDDVAFVNPWGFDLSDILSPVLLVQGGADRVVPPSHAYAQLSELPKGELWLRPNDGHVSVLAALPVTMDWLVSQQ